MSKDYGASWSAPSQISLEKEMEMLPRVYYDDRNVLHLFYHGSEGENINLFHAVSEDGNEFKTTGSLIRLTSSMRGAFFPSIVSFGQAVLHGMAGQGGGFLRRAFLYEIIELRIELEHEEADHREQREQRSRPSMVAP